MKGIFIVLLALVLAHEHAVQADIMDEVTKLGFLFPKFPSPPRPKRALSREQSMYEQVALEITDAVNFIIDSRKTAEISKHSKATFLLGLPDSGKTSIITLLTGKNPKVTEVSRVFARPVLQYTEIFPVTTVDDKSNVYIECPSVKANGNVSLDFASGYFIKKAFDNVKNVKILLVYPFSKLNTEMDEQGIFNLFSYLQELIRYINKFSNSIGLVVTNFEKGKKETNNMEIKNKVVEILIKLKQSFNESKYEFLSDDPVIGNTIQLIDILTMKSGKNDYEKIMIVNSDKDEISKKMLYREINNNLKFVEPRKFDIRYVAYSRNENSQIPYHQFFNTFMDAGYILKTLFNFFRLD